MARGGTWGKRRYTCQECGTCTFFGKNEENRAARLRCSGCGSARLDVSAMGAARQVDANDARRKAADAIERDGTGSVVPG